MKPGSLVFSNTITGHFGDTKVRYGANKGRKLVFLCMGDVQDGEVPTQSEINTLFKSMGFIPDPNAPPKIMKREGDEAKKRLIGT